MKTIETKLYSFAELSEEAKQTVLRREAERVQLDYVGDEMLNSLKAVCAACGLSLRDWSFGTYDRDYTIKVSSPADELSGNKALAWFLRVLVNHGYTRPKHFRDMTFPGICAFTGVCYDDMICETVWNSLLSGENVAKAFDSVAYMFCKQWEAEDDYARSEQGILQYLDETAEIYTEDGEEF